MALSATAQKAVNDAVEASLKDYKTKVAEKVKHYLDTGDLCTDEAVKIREDLELDAFLPRHIVFKVEVYGDLEYTHVSGNEAMGHDDTFLGDALANAVLKALEEGIEVELKDRYFHQRAGQSFKGKVKLTDADVSDFTLEDDPL